MSTSPYSTDVTLETFDRLVLEKSHQVPVLVDFWAEWCGPCRVLMPILAKLADEYGGKFFLAKVNSDDEQKLAGQFGIRGIPTVKLFRNGQVVQEFTGAQPERTIRQVLDKHVARESDAAAAEALREYQAGRTETAIAKLQAAVAADPINDRVKLQLARLLVESGQLDAGAQALKSLSSEARAEPEAIAALARLEFARIAAQAPPLTELEQAVARGLADSEARYQLAARYLLRDAFEPALDQLLEIVRQDRKFRDDVARKAMLSAFNLAAHEGELVKKYRSLLSLALH